MTTEAVTGLIAYYNPNTGFSQKILTDPRNCQSLIGQFCMELQSLNVKYLENISEDTCVALCCSYFSYFTVHL